MDKEQKIFSLIVKNSVFAYLKEKYPDYQFEDKDDEDISKIIELLKQLEKYAHIPDKKNIIKEDYNITKTYMDDGIFKEKEFLEFLKNESKDLADEEKSYILNAVIFVMNEDKNISDTEKEIILQISRFLDIDHNYKDILKNYNKSEFYKEPTPVGLIISGILLLILIGAGVFYKIAIPQQIKIFKTNDYQFDEVTFNRYIIYKNQFEIQSTTQSAVSEKFKKYAVYFISGTASIGFNPDNLYYTPLTKTITLTQESFIVTPHISPSNKKEIDKVNPKKITEGEAKTMGTVIGLAGAYAGAKTGASLGSGLTSFLPKNIGMFATTITGSVGGILAGGTGYFVTKKALTGLQVSKDISETEKKNTLRIGADLIKAQLLTDKQLISMYEEHFKTFIKAKFQSLNLEVTDIVIVYQNPKEGK